MIELILDNKDSRNLKDIKFYEIKTKNHSNKLKYDMCMSSYDTYEYLFSLGYEIFLVSIVLFDNWNFSFNQYRLKLKNIRKYTRYKNEKSPKTI